MGSHCEQLATYCSNVLFKITMVKINSTNFLLHLVNLAGTMKTSVKAGIDDLWIIIFQKVSELHFKFQFITEPLMIFFYMYLYW